MLSIQEINLLKSQNEGLKKQNEALQAELRGFQELLQAEYFKGLNANQILELAKKSIRLCAENRELENKLEDLNTELEDLRERYAEVLRLAKENADSNEYCLQELEKENAELKHLLKSERTRNRTLIVKYNKLKEKYAHA